MKSTVKELENSISEVNLNRASLDSEYEPSSLRVASIGEDGLVKYLGATAASDVLNPLLPVGPRRSTNRRAFKFL